jgi:hypothetical protein
MARFVSECRRCISYESMETGSCCHHTRRQMEQYYYYMPLVHTNWHLALCPARSPIFIVKPVKCQEYSQRPGDIILAQSY